MHRHRRRGKRGRRRRHPLLSSPLNLRRRRGQHGPPPQQAGRVHMPGGRRSACVAQTRGWYASELMILVLTRLFLSRASLVGPASTILSSLVIAVDFQGIRGLDTMIGLYEHVAMCYRFLAISILVLASRSHLSRQYSCPPS